MKEFLKYLLSVFLVNCSCLISHAEENKGTFQAQASENKSYTVYLDWFLNPHHAPLVVGLEKGFFKNEGLNVDLVAAGGSEEGSKQVSANNADIAVSKQSAHLVRVTNQKMPVVRIATLIDKPLECLITNEAYDNISDLKGKRIGFTSSSIEFATLAIKTILAEKNLTLNDVTLVPIAGGMPAALLSGQVQAIFSAYRTYELEDIKVHKPLVHPFYYEENGIPSFEQVILVTHKDKLDQPQLKKFLIALKKSCNFIKKSPEEAWKLYIKHAPEQDSQLNKKVFMKVRELLSAYPEKLNIKRYQNFANFLEKSGILNEKAPNINIYAQEIILRND